ncbi:TetR/AcrR family transcriptional regulator [Jongsikchunia kroppenstedtii]|uniref:TetR/AcrR family transcriptional regulator n=1 Tax=Jongsikchunia kroppenstedtii TaxID=1121721 RepID=UPI00037A2C23|nr:TetR/AcrR family transcriptional regulator [Jongsikchunia kroppenstedtii]
MSAGARREQILDVTHRIVDAEGFHAATVARIAEDAGINRSLIYQQFGDLPGLFVALIDREFARAGAQFLAATAQTDAADATPPLIRTFMAMLDAVDADPATWRLVVLPPEGTPPALHERLATAQQFVLTYIEQRLVSAIPGLRDPELTAHLFHAAGRQLLALRLKDPTFATPERLRALMNDLNDNIRTAVST